MSRAACLVCTLLLVSPVVSDDKPVVLKEDELAVLADPTSPDRWKLLDRHEGKVIKITGRVSYRSPSQFAGRAIDKSAGYYIMLPKRKPADEAVVISNIEWSEFPAVRKVSEQVFNKSQDDRSRRDEKKPVPEPGIALTLYGRLQKGDSLLKDRVLLVDVATDPKIGGVPYHPKVKEPVKLKDK